MSPVKIEDLRDNPEALPLLAEWHHGEWACLNPGQTIADRIELMQGFLADGLIPSTFLAIQDGVLGSAAIVANDMDTRPDLSPWLASVFVVPAHRQKGIGTRLVRYVVERARKEGFDALHLFTPDREDFYRRVGWEPIGRERYHGHEVTVMRIRLNV